MDQVVRSKAFSNPWKSLPGIELEGRCTADKDQHGAALFESGQNLGLNPHWPGNRLTSHCIKVALHFCFPSRQIRMRGLE